MSTVVINTTITGKINGKAVAINLSYTIENVTYTLDRIGRIGEGASMTSLEDTVLDPPQIDNAELVYLRLDTLTGNGEGRQSVGTSASTGVFNTGPGEGIDFHRADAGGIFAENNIATTNVLEDVTSIEQGPSWQATNAGFFAAFKPIS